MPSGRIEKPCARKNHPWSEELKKAKRIVAGLLALFFAACIVNALLQGVGVADYKGLGFLILLTILLGWYALFGDAGFKKTSGS